MEHHCGPPAAPAGGRCGVSAARFPCPGKCCAVRAGDLATEYLSVCPACSVLTLPPNGASLEIATFFECEALGYAKRLTDAKPEPGLPRAK